MRTIKAHTSPRVRAIIIEACIGGYQYPISLEVNRKVSYIPLSKLENIPIINFPKYPMSLEVIKNIPEITDTKYKLYRKLGTFCKVHTSCNFIL